MNKITEMKNKSLLLIAVFIITSLTVLAQRPQLKQSEESKARNKARAEYSAFHKQMIALKEFADEKRKVPRLQKENSVPVKIIATIDSVDNDEVKTLTGYITEQIGDNAVNAYEITFDRAEKKIIAVKKTGETEEPEPKEAVEKAASKKAGSATQVKKPVHKKKGDDDEEDDEEEPAPKEKEKDE